MMPSLSKGLSWSALDSKKSPPPPFSPYFHLYTDFFLKVTTSTTTAPSPATATKQNPSSPAGKKNSPSNQRRSPRARPPKSPPCGCATPAASASAATPATTATSAACACSRSTPRRRASRPGRGSSTAIPRPALISRFSWMLERRILRRRRRHLLKNSRSRSSRRSSSSSNNSKRDERVNARSYIIYVCLRLSHLLLNPFHEELLERVTGVFPSLVGYE